MQTVSQDLSNTGSCLPMLQSTQSCLEAATEESSSIEVYTVHVRVQV